jgi:rhamnosyltransferase
LIPVEEKLGPLIFMPAPDSSNTCAIVITYHPDQELPSRLSRLADQVGRVIVVDNASQECVEQMIHAMPRREAVEVIKNSTNEGIASALNSGLRRAWQLGYQWALTMDQDSVVDAGLIQHGAEIYEMCPFRQHIGLIGANFHLGATGIDLVRSSRTQRPWFEDATAITSGSLVFLPALKKTGLFRDDFFIDSVDHEFCLRMRARGYRIVIGRKRLMVHPIGEPKVFPLALGKKVISFDHPPIRRYYHARNRLVLIGNYFPREPQFCIREMMGIATETATILLFEPQKKQKLHAILLGFWHAITRQMGHLADEPWKSSTK